jgi:TonB family protein
MEFLINYILESGISLTLLTSVYVLFLRKETFFRQNRVFLLTSILFSVLLPLINLPAISSATPVMLSEVTVLPYRNLLSTITIYGKSVSSGFEHAVTSINIFGYIYISGVLLFFIRFAARVIQVGFLIQQNRVQSKNGYKLVVVDRIFSPFSFLNYIFVSSSIRDDEDSERMILHELEHIKQGHTIDILILEILTVFQWFNPFIWLLKRVVQENHEYLADSSVLKRGVSRAGYKQLLINQYVGIHYSLASSFNYSLIKKRLNMMSQIKSSKLAGIKYLSGFIVAIALIFSFGCEQKSSLDDEQIFKVVDDMPDYPGGEEALHKFIAESIEYPAAAKDSGIQGRVYVSFVIDSKGEVANVKIARSVSPSLDEEAMRVVKSMPIWKPGSQDGKPVNVAFIIPINFIYQGQGPYLRKLSKELKPVKPHPQFPGGSDALLTFFSKNIIYPEKAREKEISGMVFVAFQLNEKGEVTTAKVTKGVDPLLDKEALRVVRSMPRWEMSKEVKYIGEITINIPIEFKL